MVPTVNVGRHGVSASNTLLQKNTITETSTVMECQSDVRSVLIDDDDEIELPFAISSSIQATRDKNETFNDNNNNKMTTTFFTLTPGITKDSTHFENSPIVEVSFFDSKEQSRLQQHGQHLTSSLPGLASSDGSSSRTEFGESQDSINKAYGRTVSHSYNASTRGRMTANNNNDFNSGLYDSSYLDAAASLLASGTSSKVLFSSGVDASTIGHRFSNFPTTNTDQPPSQSSFVDHPTRQQQLAEEDCPLSISRIQQGGPDLASHDVSPKVSVEKDVNARYLFDCSIAQEKHYNGVDSMRLPVVHEDQQSVQLDDSFPVCDFANHEAKAKRNSRSLTGSREDAYSRSSSSFPIPASSQLSTTYVTNPIFSTAADGSTTILPPATPLVSDTVTRLLLMEHYSNFIQNSRQNNPSLLFASLAGAVANRTGNMSFQVTIDVNIPVVQTVMDIVANPELLRLWCNPIMSGAPFVITKSSEGAQTVWNWRNRPSDALFTPPVMPASEQSSNVTDSYNQGQSLEQQRQYEGEWIEATTVGPVIEPPSSKIINIAGSIHKTCQFMSSMFGCPQYGKVSMFIERQKGQVSLTIGPFAGNIEVHHLVRVLAATENNTNSGMYSSGKVRIIDDVRLRRTDDDDSNDANGSTCCNWKLLQNCYHPNLDDHMHQAVSSMARLRFLIENGATGEIQVEPQYVVEVSGCRNDNSFLGAGRNIHDENLSAPLLQHA